MKKTVLVTGGAKGIGKQISKDFARLGYNVCINYNSSENDAIKLKDELASLGYSVLIYKADISKKDEVEKMVDKVIETFGNIEVLVNNAGICNYNLFTDISYNDMKNVYLKLNKIKTRMQFALVFFCVKN